MEMSLHQELNLTKMMHIFNKMMKYFDDCNQIEMSRDEFSHIVDIQLAKVITEGRLDEVYNKIINV